MKKWTKEEIKDLLAKNDIAVIKGLIRIYELQTETEKAIEETSVNNGVGFTGFDGKIMTSIANQFLEKRYVTEGQFNVIKRKMTKYAGQLAKVANGEILPLSNRHDIKILPGWLRPSRRKQLAESK